MSLLAAACLLAGAFGASAATQIPSGKWSFVWTDMQGRADRPMRVYTFRPKSCDTKCPIQMVLHGTNRNASAYRDHWEFLAERYKLIIVAPEFSQQHWAKAAGFTLGDMANQPDREKWAFAALEHLFDEVRDGQATYRVFGHSSGAQFLQRMAFFRPDNRASLMVAANPRWYTFPEWRKDKGAEAFPYSLLNSRAGEAELRQALGKRFVLLVGAKDADPEDDLAGSDKAVKQGDTSTDRAENFIKAATAAANELGVALAWELVELPEAVNDTFTLSRYAAEMQYGKR